VCCGSLSVCGLRENLRVRAHHEFLHFRGQPSVQQVPLSAGCGSPRLRPLSGGCRGLSVWGLQGSLSAGREASADCGPEDYSSPRKGGILKPAERLLQTADGDSRTQHTRGLSKPSDGEAHEVRRRRDSRSPPTERLPLPVDGEAPAARRQRSSRSPKAQRLLLPAGSEAPAVFPLSAG
jgi:hypothetical protein